MQIIFVFFYNFFNMFFFFSDTSNYQADIVSSDHKTSGIALSSVPLS